MSVVVRFIIGTSSNTTAEAALQQEAAQHGDFMQIDMQVRVCHV